jgi:beta-xylosidase
MIPYLKITITLCLFNLFGVQAVYAQNRSSGQVPRWGDWQTWGDLGNGTYQNPILPADYSDLDCIRVGDDYYAISSTFQYSPGMVILHSKDLVNWTIKSHAINDLRQISPELNWDKMNRYGRGVWAGAIRHHNNRFWIYFGTPDEGYFMTSAKNIEGPWEPLHCLLAENGWDDCCPFWDDDGQGYFVGTNFKDSYKIHLFKLTADGKDLIRDSDQVIYQSKGSEANKLYKFNNFYYHFFSEVTGAGRVVMMTRAKTIWGPYEKPRQLSFAQKEFHEPNQGGIVQTQHGDWYFLTHHGSGDWSGRNMSLLPVNWVDGWPILGKPTADNIGRMVWSGKIPVNGLGRVLPQTSDEFNTSELSVQWEWNYQPRADKWSLSARKGWLRLHASRPLIPNNLLKAANTITQRTMRTKGNAVILKMDVSGMKNGQKAGLSHFGSPKYSAFGVSCDDKALSIELTVNGVSERGTTLKKRYLWLKTTWGLDGLSQYYYSTDGKEFLPFGKPYQMSWGAYRGDRLAIYSYNNLAEEGYVDIDYFKYTYPK